MVHQGGDLQILGYPVDFIIEVNQYPLAIFLIPLVHFIEVHLSFLLLSEPLEAVVMEFIHYSEEVHDYYYACFVFFWLMPYWQLILKFPYFNFQSFLN